MTTVMALKQTPLLSWHQQAGAKLVPFAGWEMPLQFSKVKTEHEAVRTAAGLFDIGHMGQIVVSGPDQDAIRDFLNRLVPQDLTTLYPGKAVYTQFLNESGGIIDDLIVYQLPETVPFAEFKDFLVICNAGNTDLVWNWLQQHKTDSAIQLELVSKQYSLFALQGPQFHQVLAKLGVDITHLPKRFHIEAAVKTQSSVPAMMLCRTGYTGEDGVEIIVANSDAQSLWTTLLNAGEPLGLLPVGLAARDTLRLEAAYPLHGHDIGDQDTPLEAGLGWSVKLDQAADFIGKSALQQQKANGFAKKLYCLTFADKVIARQHDTVLINGLPSGQVTSGSISPTLNIPVAMAYISAPKPLQPGDTVEVDIRGKTVTATVVKKPFYETRPSVTI